MISKNKTAILIAQLLTKPDEVVFLEEDTIRSLRRNFDKFSNQSGFLGLDELTLIQTALVERKLHIGKVQTEKGFLWLHKQIWTPTGCLRNTQNGKFFKAHHRGILGDFSHFELADLEDVSAGRQRAMHLPRYRVVSKGGSYFTYLAGSWQSGYGLDVR